MPRPGNRRSPSAIVTGRPSNRPNAPDLALLLVAQKVSAGTVEAASMASGVVDFADIGVDVQGYAAELARYQLGQINQGVRGISANYAIGDSDTLILADASSGAIAVALPAASAVSGRTITVKKTDASGNAVTVTPAGTDTIDGGASYVIAAMGNTVTLVSDGAGDWQSI